MDTVERCDQWLGLQTILDPREAQTYGRCDLQRVFRTVSLRQDQQASMPEPVEKEQRTRDDDEDAGEQR